MWQHRSLLRGVCCRPGEPCAVLGCSQFRVGVEKRVFNPAKILLRDSKQDVASQNGNVRREVPKNFR